jgi:hypothetical protein
MVLLMPALMLGLRAKNGFCKAFLIIILVCSMVPVSLGADSETVEVQFFDQTIGVNARATKSIEVKR